MKAIPLILALATVAGFGSTSSLADYRPGYSDKARVISSMPVHESVNEPSRQCWTDTVGYGEPGYRNRDDHGHAIVGAIAGGLLGSTVGKGSGRVAGAAVGAVTGAAIGNRIADDDDDRGPPRQVEHCRVTDNYHDVVVGYDVVYRFHGEQYRARLAYEPGRWLDVNADGTLLYR